MNTRHSAASCLLASFALVAVLLGNGPLMAQSPDAAAASAASLAAMEERVAAASERGAPWNGPGVGPEGRSGKTIAILSEDLRNGGILGVAQGIHEAAKVLQWTVRVFDAGGTEAGRSKAVEAALAQRPDGLILVGGDATGMQSRLRAFAERRIPVVGWHVGPHAGPMPDSPVAMNVSTDPLEVARITAMAAVTQARGRAGVVIFTDSNYAIAMAKAEAMAEVINACEACTLLEMRDVAIARSDELMPAVTQELLAVHGERWTHGLAINDIYFDYAVPELIKAGWSNRSISLLSAGDGSAAAFMRIQAGTFQTGTVAEPLNQHGWQLVDELNRLFAGEPVSGHVVPVHLVTADNVAYDGGARFQYDPDNGYRDAYRRIWKR